MKRLPVSKSLEDYSKTAITINEIIDSLWWIDPLINPNCGTVEPPSNYRKDGKLAYADGASWKPNGTGDKGLYRWDAATSSWVKVG